MLYKENFDGVSVPRTDWDRSSIKSLFWEKKMNLLNEIEETIVEIANSKEYGTHYTDFIFCLLDMFYLVQDADARINGNKNWEILEDEYHLSFQGVETEMDNLSCMIQELHRINQFINDMHWEKLN